jgi:hypothetical protein
VGESKGELVDALPEFAYGGVAVPLGFPLVVVELFRRQSGHGDLPMSGNSRLVVSVRIGNRYARKWVLQFEQYRINPEVFLVDD